MDLTKELRNIEEKYELWDIKDVILLSIAKSLEEIVELMKKLKGGD